MPNQTHRAPPRYKIPGFFSILIVQDYLAKAGDNLPNALKTWYARL
jgi:hypothetical protein